ncbi:MAG: Dam family site-specific DNA-(adenine-N6)-methyltransferase [Bacteroides sp.]|nr:Dam family site-specific DNA-(adenine-N6)-methyltransferase [Bacteroides sp.]
MKEQKVKNTFLRSPLNYIGGKYKLLPQMSPLFPKNINTFVDIFCGGCNVGINVDAGKVIFNDNLIYLIDLYNSLRTSSLEDILAHIEERISTYNLSLTNEEGYKAFRAHYNEVRNPLDLFVLVAYSFNHQIRFNNKHEFNNPFGRERSSFNPSMKVNLQRFVNAIKQKDVKFTSFNFDDMDLSFLGINDYVYCDPPYLITTGSYNDGRRGFTGWDKSSEIKLLEILDSLQSRGIGFGLSNVLTHKGKTNSILAEWIKDNHYKVYHLSKSYKNSNYQSAFNDGNITDEVFVTNKIEV